jgi:UDP-3-O-[3-hydroxymyristoyl] glucosamine N-acyltransferase
MITARELASELDAELSGNELCWDKPLIQVAAIDQAQPGSLTFLASKKFTTQFSQCQATAILTRPDTVTKAPGSAALILVSDPYAAYARVSHRFSKQPLPSHQVDQSAVVAIDAQLGSEVSVGANAVIGAATVIGDGCTIGAGVVLEAGVMIGARTTILANVTVRYDVRLGEDCRVQPGTVIGSDGFGFAPTSGRWHRIAQLGTVVIGDRVDIGANVTIDRGAVGDTVIENDVIIDNLVQIAHNVVLGQATALAGQVGVAGSTNIGAGCTIGGQSGLAGHIEITPGAHFTGQSMVTKSVTEAGAYSSGWPVQPSHEWRRTVVRLRQLDRYEQRLKTLEKALMAGSVEPKSED